jgi:integrase
MAIEKYKNGWRVNVHAGKSAANLPSPYTGKKRLTRVVTSSHAEAKKIERELQQMVVEARTGETEMTAKKLLPEFLGGYDGPTRQTYDFALRTFMREHGDKPLAEWDEREARKVAANLPKGNVIVVKTFFSRATDQGHIQRNPFRDIAPSSGRQIRTKEEFHKLWPQDPKKQQEVFSHIIQTARENFGPEAAGLVAFAGYTGCRPGEAFVLRRDNLDLKNDEAELIANYDRSAGTETPGTKNRLTRKIVVPTHPELRDALANLPVHLHQPYVFTNQGMPWKPPTWYNRWNQIRKLSGNPKMRFYDLRHFCATQLLEAGVEDADVAVQLGHEDGGELVRTVYGHPSRDAARDRIRHMLKASTDEDRHTVRHIDFGKGA